MSNQALVWKFAFGVLVLLFCGVAFVTRKEIPPHALAPIVSPVRAPQAAAPVPLPPASAPPALLDAPADVPEAQEEPVRIRISLHEPPVVKIKKHHAVKHVVRKAAHRRSHRLPSPYLAGRQHYPFDPRERWHFREG